MPWWSPPAATVALMRSTSPLAFLPSLTSRKQRVRPDAHLPTCPSWIVFLIMTLLRHIDHFVPRETNQGLGPSTSPGLAWSRPRLSPASPLLPHPLANSRGLASPPALGRQTSKVDLYTLAKPALRPQRSKSRKNLLLLQRTDFIFLPMILANDLLETPRSSFPLPG